LAEAGLLKVDMIVVPKKIIFRPAGHAIGTNHFRAKEVLKICGRIKVSRGAMSRSVSDATSLVLK
tara:strand:- start:28791 stop:28985 length:195 start_codon:yes stop_codon:yes gene_type:complete